MVEFDSTDSFMENLLRNLFNFSGSINLNKIIWISGLDESESGPVSKMVEDVQAISVGKRITVDFFHINSAQELHSLLSDIAEQSNRGLRPALHFDFHGHKGNGLYISNKNEYYDWSDLTKDLRAINISTDNNVFVFFATCYAYHLVSNASILKETPFSYGIMPPNEIKLGTLIDYTTKFYRDILEGKGVYQAYLEYFADSMIDYNYQQVYFDVLVGYFRSHCDPESIDGRIEALSEQIDAAAPFQSRQQKRLMARSAKKWLKPGQKIIDQYANVFLMGRKPQFTFNQLKPVLVAEGIIEQ